MAPEYQTAKHGPIWRHPSRLLRYYRLRLLRLKDRPEIVAKGLALGVFVGILPIVPFHTVTALGLAFLFRGSKVSALIGTLVSNPLDMVPHYMLVYYLGHKIIPLDIPPFNPSHLDLRVVLDEGWALMATLMTGGLIVALPSALVAYFLCLRVLHRYRSKRGG
jgi:Uncharacterized protein conserved in bacteria